MHCKTENQLAGKPGPLIYGCNAHTSSIGGYTRTAGAAIVAPLWMLGQQPIQNAAQTQMMFV